MPISLSSKPVLALTMGDPAGIGPEIILRSLSSPAVKDLADYIIVGDLKVLIKAQTALDRYNAPCLKDLSEINIIDLKNAPKAGFLFGRESAACGRASVEYIKKAFDLISAGTADGMVTAPINKSAAGKAGFLFPGHTEYLANLAGVKDFVMMLEGGPLRVSLVTRHIRLRNVPKRLTVKNITDTITITINALKEDFGIARPRICVSALNPHAGEGGMFGNEEAEIILPAVRKFRNSGVTGPFPADAVFYDAYKGKFDCVICLYHDQGLIPLKMIARDRGVNITLGLGFVRTSPDHGTAFDIAGKAKADPGSMETAIKTAARMTLNRNRDAVKK